LPTETVERKKEKKRRGRIAAQLRPPFNHAVFRELEKRKEARSLVQKRKKKGRCLRIERQYEHTMASRKGEKKKGRGKSC